MLLIVSIRLRTRHAQCDFWAINILCISAYMIKVSDRWVSRMLTPNCIHKLLKNFSNDNKVTQQKFISQLFIQDETCVHNFDSESEQQSMQWNEQNQSKLSLADRTNGCAIATLLRLSSSVVVCLSSVTLCIVAKRCVLEQALL